STNVSIQQEAARLAELAYQRNGARRAALLGLSTPWGQDYMRFFRQRFEQLGGSASSMQDSPIGQTDFRAELLRVGKEAPDVIFVAHVSGMLGDILKQAREIGINQPFLGTDEAEDRAVIDTARVASEGFQYLLPQHESDVGAPAELNKKWKERFGGS